MIVNRIRELRKAQKGLTLEKLAAQVNSTTTTIQRLEKGEVDLVHELLEPIARVFGVDWLDLVTPPRAPAMPRELAGLAESAAPFKPPPQHTLKSARLADHEALFEVKSNDLEKLGLYRGDVLIFDVSAKAVRQVATGDVVVAQVYGPGLTDAVTVLRQFVAPSLLVTNRKGAKTAMDVLDMDELDAAIKGVGHRRFGAIHPPRLGA